MTTQSIQIETKTNNNKKTTGSNFYWIGNGAVDTDWNTPSAWSAVSGGTSCNSTPSSADDVFFDSNSGTAKVLGATPNTVKCHNLDFTNYTGNFAVSVQMQISGSLTLGSGMAYSASGGILFNSTNTTESLTFNGIGFLTSSNNALIFNGSSTTTWTVETTFSNPFSTIQLDQGTLNLNGQTVNADSFVATGLNTSTLTFGTSTVNVRSIYSCSGSALTISAGSSTINLTGNGGFFSKSAVYGTLNLTNTTPYLQTPFPAIYNPDGDGPLTFSTLSRTNTSGYVACNIACDIIVSTSLTLRGNNANTQRLGVINGLLNTSVTITSNGTNTLTNVDFLGITAAGTADWSSGTSIGDCGGNSGITFTAPVTRYLKTSAGSNDFMGNIYSTSSGGTVGASRPLPHDTVVIDANSFTSSSRTLVVGPYRLPTLDFTNATNSPTLSFGSITGLAPTCLGDLTLISGMSVVTGTTTSLFFWKQSGTQTLTCAGKTIPVNIRLLGNSTFTLADSLTTSKGLYWFNGSINDGNFNHTLSTFTSSTSLILTTPSRTWNKGTGTLSITGTGSSGQGAWDMRNDNSSVTFTDSGTIKFTNNSATHKYFTGEDFTYNNLWVATLGSGSFIMNTDSKSPTFNDFKSDAGRTLKFKAGTTTTFNTLSVSGTSGNLTTLTSTTSAQHNLVSTGTNVSLTYMNISYSNASGATFTATSSTDSGGNSGWNISIANGSWLWFL